MNIGNKIKKIRELRNYTQEHMADRLGISTAGYGRIERDEVNLSFDRLTDIAQVLDVKPSDIVDFDEKFIFNNCNNSLNGLNINGTISSENERKLYEQQIELLKEQNKVLLELLEKWGAATK